MGRNEHLPTDTEASVCVLRLSAIGDCCHALAVLRTLQHQRPGLRLTWVIDKVAARLMQGLDGVELIVYDKRGGRPARKALAAALAARQFDVLLNMHASWRANGISRLIRARRKIGFDRARARDFQWLFTDERIAQQYHPHVLDGMFGFAEALGVTQRVLSWRLPLGDADMAFAERLVSDDGPTLVISPCSSERARNFRNWPVERFVAAADYAASHHGAQILVTGAGTELERDYASHLASATDAEVVDLVGRTSLKELAAVIRQSTAVLCPDSGPAHIATAVGTPVIGLYATSNPGRTGPYLSTETLVDYYPQAVSTYLGKTVDEVRWGRRVRHPEAMALIPLEAVTARLDQLLA